MPSRSTKLEDSSGVEIFTETVIDYRGKIYKVVDEGFRVVLERTMYPDGENIRIPLDEDVAMFCKVIPPIDSLTILLKND